MNEYETISNSSAIYVDTCALVKVDAKRESGSNFARVLIYGTKIPIYSSFIGFGEFIGVVRIPLNPDTDSSLKPDSVPLESGHP